MNIFWLRRDLRLDDNAGLYHALKTGKPVLPLFIFDTDILDDLKDPNDRRVEFIHQEITRLHTELKAHGSSLLVKYGKPIEVMKEVVEEYPVEAVFTNRDYEPYAKERDKAVADLLKEKGIGFHHYKDQVAFDGDEVLKDNGEPYTVYSPYAKRWRKQQQPADLDSYPTEKYFDNFYTTPSLSIIGLKEMGFEPVGGAFPPRKADKELIENYHKTRNIPGIHGTSRLSVHFRFGTISIRKAMRRAQELNGKFFAELIWRDFYQMILDHFPKVVTENFNPKYDTVQWRNNKEEFEKWCKGQTGYPIVDAGMRELNTTGYMHNRVRMITASFLTKHLLVDWRWGEAYFGEKLLDYDLASNNGGWQWAAGTGVDAAPYFRIFNPYTQAGKFDPERKYIKHFVPEIDTDQYPEPIVEHKFARERCLAAYKEAITEKDTSRSGEW